MIVTRICMILVVVLTGTSYVFGQTPVANFTANVTSGCAPLTVTFTDQSTGNPNNWNWEFSNGTLSNAQNPVVTFSDPGTYSVKLVVQNADGIAQVEKIAYITVFPSPAANFTADITLGCIPSVIQFTDQSTSTVGNIISWHWDFGDGGTSSQQNPTHTYNNEGFYTVSLTVTTSNGCFHNITRTSYIRVLGSISTDFSFTQPSSCLAPYTVNFVNQSNGPGNISYNWDFGNSQTSTAVHPSAIYNAPGTYTVTLNAQSDLGCTGSVQKTITINSTTTDFNAPNNVCLNQPISFQNASSSFPIRSNWDFGDGTISAQINPTKIFLTPGVYDVKLINRYISCTDSITKTITVNDRPVVNFSADDSTFCNVPAVVQFTDLSPGALSWHWDFGDGGTSNLQNPSHQFNSFGNFVVSLTISTSTGCSNTLVKPIFIQIQEPEITINVPDGGCIPFTYTPQAIINTVDPIATYVWNLGEPGAVFNVQNPPPYTYNNVGSYNISLTVTTVAGCTKTVTIPNGIRTGTPPTVDFSFSPNDACASTPIQFTDLTTGLVGGEVIWDWDFGDGNESNQQNPSHVFADTGVLNVNLTVSNNRCRINTIKTIKVLPPVAYFNYQYNCATRQMTFIDSSLVDLGLAPLIYSWDFGNGMTSNVPNPPPITYVPGGPYTVTLTVTNGVCTFIRTRDITIAAEAATFNASKTDVCKNETFTLTATGSDPAKVASYEWIVGGVVLSGTSRSITHSIGTNGTYDVTLNITDINGCVTTTTRIAYIAVKGPVANFASVNPGACLNATTTFTDLSTPVGDIASWNFNFGDGNQQTFTAPPFTHTYTQYGGYEVSLTITDRTGCSDTYALPASILVTKPFVGFRADTFYCPQAPLQFSDTSIGAGLTYFWDFGDGNTSTLSNPQNSYPLGDASYTVKLVVTDISGCIDSVTKQSYIKIRSPKAAFSIKDSAAFCPPLRTSFTFEGADYQTFYWSFGDGGISTVLNPTNYYSNYGTYTPTLYTIGPGGCIDSAKSNVVIHNPNEVQINFGPPTTACNSLNVDFNLVMPPGFKFYYYFGDGSIDSSQRLNFSHFYPQPSLSNSYLIIIDSITGCNAVVYGQPRIDVLGAIPLFGQDKDEFCEQGTVIFTDFTTKNEPIISSLWDFGDGNTSTSPSPTHTYTQAGTFITRLTVTTQSNCISSYEDTVFVYQIPQPIITGRDTICVNIAEPYSGSIAVSDTLTNWNWNLGNGQTSTQTNVTALYSTPGNYNLQLITTNKIGCSDTTTKTIFVSPLPTASPVNSPITINSGGSANLLMNYTGNIVSYIWTPSTRLNCEDCPAPIANPQATTEYTVQVTDRYGCRNSGEITVIVVCNGENFFVPNTFSPNGDGRNDVFFPRGTGLFRVKSMTLFNRWGQIVFDKKDFTVNDPSQGWDGSFKGQKASPDVYVYMIELLCDNNTVIPVKGNVTLLR